MISQVMCMKVNFVFELLEADILGFLWHDALEAAELRYPDELWKAWELLL